jgi:hypothetical protein
MAPEMERREAQPASQAGAPLMCVNTPSWAAPIGESIHRTDRFRSALQQAEVIMNKCQPLALGIAIGVLWAIYVGCLGITAMFGWGVALVTALASLYIGYGASILGAVVGAIWAFVDGFVAGIIIAWMYNLVAGSE